MVSALFLVLVVLLWTRGLLPVCRAEEASREESVSWFMDRVLESLGLGGPPTEASAGPRGGGTLARPTPPAPSQTSWTTQGHDPTIASRDTSEMILFPGPEPTCVGSGSTLGENTSDYFSYHFRPAVKSQDTVVTSASFWFFAGRGVNSSAPLFLAAPGRRSVQVAEGPSRTSSDGWATYALGRDTLGSAARGPFLLRVRCPLCDRGAAEVDETPFLHLRLRARPRRSRRSAPVGIPWSPSAVDLLQRPSRQRPTQGDCQRAQVEISFQELGWDHWIVHPKALTFYYCHGNCLAADRTAAALGIRQCCAPVPGSMRSLRITTTSDGGYSFKYETLPNIIPEECACV